MKRYLGIIQFPLAATVINWLLFPLYDHLPGGSHYIVFNTIRILLWAFAGWRLSHVGGYSLWRSALSGAVLLFIDHPILTGGRFLLQANYMAFGGVVASFIVFCFVPVLISAIGAALGKRNKRSA